MAGTGRFSAQQDGNCGVNAALSGDSGRRHISWGSSWGLQGLYPYGLPFRQHVAQLSLLPL